MPDEGLRALINEADARKAQRDPLEPNESKASLLDFYAHLPDHKFLHLPTLALWPAASVDSTIEWPLDPVTDKRVKPSVWLDRHRPIEQMTWHPDYPQLITDRIAFDGGWLRHPGARVFNLYRPPQVLKGDASKAGPWLEHLRAVYPGDYDHLLAWFAQRVQRPGEKINHAVVLGGDQGVGKDTLLAPVIAAVGPWNCHEISPTQMLGRFNGWAKSVLVRVSEARDLGEVDRFSFYDHSKTYIAAPPDTIRCDEKNLREHMVFNVLGMVITTNHRTDGLYIPADDRRHYVAWSERNKADFDANYWRGLWKWYEAGGAGHVAAYLRTFDLSGFDPKAPPPKTAAFLAMVAAGEDPEAGELRDVLDAMGPPLATTLDLLASHAASKQFGELASDLRDRKARRSIPHKLERVGYVAVRNPDAQDGLWVIEGRRQTVYARRELAFPEQMRAARSLK